MLPTMPKHVAIMCDGNGRWGLKHGLSRSMGHKKGAEPVKEIIKACSEAGVEFLTLYVLSTENWSRSKEEVDFLIKLFIEFFTKLRSKEIGNIKVKHIGITDKIPEMLLKEIKDTEVFTANNDGMILNVALNYGARSEITYAAKNLLQSARNENLALESIDEGMIDNFLFTAGQPEVDLLIRTSGESRISNFLLWQAAKAEIWITPVLWPDFKKEDLLEAFTTYANRKHAHNFC